MSEQLNAVLEPEPLKPQPQDAPAAQHHPHVGWGPLQQVIDRAQRSKTREMMEVINDQRQWDATVVEGLMNGVDKRQRVTEDGRCLQVSQSGIERPDSRWRSTQQAGPRPTSRDPGRRRRG